LRISGLLLLQPLLLLLLPNLLLRIQSGIERRVWLPVKHRLDIILAHGVSPALGLG
jgi:hypothetical protein